MHGNGSPEIPMDTNKLTDHKGHSPMNWQKCKTRIAREWLWLFITVLSSSLLWYLVSSFFPEFWTSLSITLLRLLSPEGGSLIKNRAEVIVYLDILTIVFVYVLRFTAWAKRQVKFGG
jgi:hypothetical protein